MWNRMLISGAVVLFGLMAGLLQAQGPATIPATHPAAGPFLITGTLADATSNPGGELLIHVNIKNVSAENQKIEVRRSFWFALSDSPSIQFAEWGKRGGHGPAVNFEKISLAPGESYDHDWPATVAKDAAPGKITFHIGIDLHIGRHDPQWSQPIELTVVAATPSKYHSRGRLCHMPH